MKVGQRSFEKSPFQKNLNDLDPKQRTHVINNFKETHWNPSWDNQQFTDQGLEFPRIVSKYGNAAHCKNDQNPDPTPPPELFNFDLILNGRRFRVLCDTLLRIEHEEDLGEYSEGQLKNALELCSSYRVTCLCAWVGAHKETRKWKVYHDLWMAEKRTEARNHIKNERILEKEAKERKDIGQITAQEVEDWIMTRHTNEYKNNLSLIADWENNEKIFLELRDTLKDRGMHLQTLLKKSDDHSDPNHVSDGSSI